MIRDRYYRLIRDTIDPEARNQRVGAREVRSP